MNKRQTVTLGGIGAVVAALVAAYAFWYQFYSGFEVRFSERMSAFEVIGVLQEELNESMGSADLRIPLVIVNRETRPLRLHDAEATLDAKFYRYFVGSQEHEEWFRYRVSFDQGTARVFPKRDPSKSVERPTVETDFEGELELGGTSGLFPRVRVDEGEKSIYEFLRSKQTVLSEKIFNETVKREEELEQKIEEVFDLGKPTGWLRSPRVEAYRALRDELILDCPSRFGSVQLGDNISTYLIDAKEDQGFIAVTLRMRLVSTHGRDASAVYGFLAECEVQEDVYRWIKEYPADSLGFGKYGESIRR